MVLDSSALLAILQDEPERRAFNEAIEADDVRLLSVASFVEASIITEARRGAEGIRVLDLFLERAGVTLVDVTADHGFAVRQALRHARLPARATEIRVQREPFEAKGARGEAFEHLPRFGRARLWHAGP